MLRATRSGSAVEPSADACIGRSLQSSRRLAAAPRLHDPPVLHPLPGSIAGSGLTCPSMDSAVAGAEQPGLPAWRVAMEVFQALFFLAYPFIVYCRLPAVRHARGRRPAPRPACPLARAADSRPGRRDLAARAAASRARAPDRIGHRHRRARRAAAASDGSEPVPARDLRLEPARGSADRRAVRASGRSGPAGLLRSLLPQGHDRLVRVPGGQCRVCGAARGGRALRMVGSLHGARLLSADRSPIRRASSSLRKLWFRFYRDGLADRVFARLFPAERTANGRRSLAYVQRRRERAATRPGA